jgi:hypothetical protein
MTLLYRGRGGKANPEVKGMKDEEKFHSFILIL